MNGTSLCAAQFQPNEIINSYEMKIFELVKSFFSEPYYSLVELPLQLICAKTRHLDDELWKFWVNSRVDIVVMQTALGCYSRKACLAIECQSSYHYSSDARRRDGLKASILSNAGIPLVYVELIGRPDIFRFWTLSQSQSVRVNLGIQEEKNDLSRFLKEICLR